MVREAAVREPLVPVVGGLDQTVVGLGVGLGAGVVGERERDEGGVAVAQRGERPHPGPFEADPQVGRQRQLGRPAVGGRDRLVVALADVLPVRVAAAVVEDRIALELDLDAAVDAAHGPQQHVVGVVVRGRAPVGGRALLGVVPRADQQHVADDHPAAVGAPRRLEDHRAGQVAARRGDHRVGGAEPERARVAIQQRAEHAGAVIAREAHPFDGAARSHERARLAVRQEAVVRDRRKRRDERGIRVLERHGALILSNCALAGRYQHSADRLGVLAELAAAGLDLEVGDRRHGAPERLRVTLLDRRDRPVRRPRGAAQQLLGLRAWTGRRPARRPPSTASRSLPAMR